MAGDFLGQLLVKINADSTDLESGLNKSRSSLQGFADRAQRVGATLTTRLTLPIAAAGAAALKFAIDAEETRSKFNTAFRGIEETAVEVSERLQEEYGLSSLEAERLLSTTGDLLKGFGASADTALGLSNQVQQLAADLASYNNVQGGTAAASQALTAALLGEREQLKQLGIVIRQEDVNQQLLLNGQQDLTGQAKLLATAQATLQLAVQQSGDAIGDVARTSDSAANQLRFLKADAIDLAVEIGRELIPVALNVIEFLRDAVAGFSGLDDGTKRFIITLAGVTAAIGPAISALSAFSKSLAFLAANPILAVIAGVAAVGIGIARIAKTAREAQLAELEAEMEGLGLAAETTAEQFELVGDALRLGSFSFSNEFGNGLERVREQVGELSKNLDVSVDDVIRIGLAADDVNESFKAQLQILFDEREQIRAAGAAYAQFAADRQRSEEEYSEQQAEQVRLAEEQRQAQQRLNEIAAIKRQEIRETFQARLDELNATDEIAKIELERAEALEDAAASLVRTGAEVDLINEYYDRQIELIEDAKQLELEREEAIRETEAALIERNAADRVLQTLETELEAIERKKQAEIEAAEAVGAETTAIVEFYESEKDRIREENAEREEERIKRLRDLQIDAGLEAVTALNDLFSSLAARQTQRVDEQYERERQRIEDTIEDEAEREAALEELDEKTEARKKKIARDEAKREKAVGILSATVDTARAIIGFLADPGGLPGVLLSATAGITGAAQIAAIAAQPLPQLAEGGFFDGPAVVGEAGPEVAIPLSGSQGRAALGLMADSIVSAIERRGNTVNNTSNVTLQSNSIFPSFESQDQIREAARLLLPALEGEAQRRGTSILGGR